MVGDTTVLLPVCPPDHVTLPPQPEAVSVALPPALMLLGLAEILGAPGGVQPPVQFTVLGLLVTSEFAPQMRAVMVRLVPLRQGALAGTLYVQP